MKPKNQISRIVLGISLLGMLFFSACKKATETKVDLSGCMVDQTMTGFNGEPKEKNYLFISAKGFVVRANSGYLRFSYMCLPKFYLEFWGALNNKENGFNHESFLGKHIKDRKSWNRTLIFPDGTKVTLVTDGPNSIARTLYIYDEASVYIIDLITWTYKEQKGKAMVNKYDGEIVDGEASRLEFNHDEAYWYNEYNEFTPGHRTKNKIDLGKSGPDNQVNDLYDDPDLSNS